MGVGWNVVDLSTLEFAQRELRAGDVGQGGVVAVEPGTTLQVRNETDDELVLIYGAPPEQAGADFFDDVPQ